MSVFRMSVCESVHVCTHTPTREGAGSGTTSWRDRHYVWLLKNEEPFSGWGRAERPFQEVGTGCAKARGVTERGMLGVWQQQSRDRRRGEDESIWGHTSGTFLETSAPRWVYAGAPAFWRDASSNPGEGRARPGPWPHLNWLHECLQSKCILQGLESHILKLSLAIRFRERGDGSKPGTCGKMGGVDFPSLRRWVFKTLSELAALCGPHLSARPSLSASHSTAPAPSASDFYILEHEKVQHKPTTAKYSLFPQAPTRAELLSLGVLPIQYRRGGAE